MKTNTLFIIGGLALAAFAISKSKKSTPATTTDNTPVPVPGIVPVVNANATTQEQVAAMQQATFIANYKPGNPWLTPTSTVPWASTGGQPGGGGLLPLY